jgi:two-component system phosphate regulon response regulator PhoB
MSEKILIVEDEGDILKLVDFTLRKAGYSTIRASSGREALDAVQRTLPDLVVLDLMLPDIRGTDICTRLKQDERTAGIPVIMLTAKSEEIDRVVGFELGADDYMTKPFSARELALRVRAILRRTKSSPEQTSKEEVLRFGEVTIDTGRHRAWIRDEEVHLTNLEFDLLSTFIRRRGRVQSRDTLLNDVWGLNAAVTTRTVDTHVRRLREKLGDIGDYIETVRGIGYRFIEAPDANKGS